MSTFSENSGRRKLRVLHVIPTFHPATYWGGPIYATYGLCNALVATEKVEIDVMTTDAAGPLLSERLLIGGIPIRFPEGYDVHYFRRLLYTSVSPALLTGILKVIRTVDIVHLSGTYSFPTIPTLAMARAFQKPLVWSPHGALQRWRNTKKPGTKWVWDQICSTLLDSSMSILHVTSIQEAHASILRISRAKTCVIPFGITVPDAVGKKARAPDGRLRLLYMGRLDPIKGIPNLIRAVGQVPAGSVQLSIYGTGDKDNIRDLYNMVQDQHLEQLITIHGFVAGTEKTSAFYGADVLVLPSYSENFGLAIAEALAHGVPVIAGKGTPWSDVETRNCGLWVDNDPETLAKAIVHMRDMDLERMGENGRQWMRESFGWQVVASRLIDTYFALATR